MFKYAVLADTSHTKIIKIVDYIKLITDNQTIIKQLEQMQDFKKYPHRNNNYDGFCRNGKLMRLDFRKSFVKGVLVGYHHVEISLSPHYHFNSYLHNGNDFKPEDCIKVIKSILIYLKIEPNEYDLLKVVNIEFGLNLVPHTNIKDLIDGLLFYKKTSFKIGDFPYYRKTDATIYKQIKAYAKGLQFSDFPQYNININTFRFEVKTKQSKNIRGYGINTVADLLKFETYYRLGQMLLYEWEHVLLINKTPDFSHLNTNDVRFIRTAQKLDFWSDLKHHSNRNKFTRYKIKYYNILTSKNNLHHQIKLQLIDKLFLYGSGATSTQRHPTNTDDEEFSQKLI